LDEGVVWWRLGKGRKMSNREGWFKSRGGEDQDMLFIQETLELQGTALPAGRNQLVLRCGAKWIPFYVPRPTGGLRKEEPVREGETWQRRG